MTETAAIRTLAKMSQANILRRGMLVRRAIASARPSAARAAPARAYQIASSQYAAAFDVPRPPVDREALRAATLAYLDGFKTLLLDLRTKVDEIATASVLTAGGAVERADARLETALARVDAMVEEESRMTDDG